MPYIYFMLSILSLCFTWRKIRTHKDIMVFDVFLFSNFLYLYLVPFYYYLIGSNYAKEVWNKGDYAYLLCSIYQLLLLILNYICYHKKITRYSILNISYQLRKINDGILCVSKGFVILFTISIFFKLYTTINYTNLEGKKISSAFSYEHATEDSSVDDKIYNKLTSFFNLLFYPTLFYAIIAKNKDNKKKTKYWSLFVIISVFVTLALSSRTSLVNTILFLFVYYYSISKRKIPIRKFFISGVSIVGFIMFFFPIYQAYRLSKESALLNETGVTFSMVLDYGLDKVLSKETMEQIQEATVSRSLNAISSIEYVSNSNLRYNGWVFYKCMTHVKPGLVPINENVEFQLASNYYAFASDIADSFLMYGIADLGMLGPFLAIVYILLLCLIYTFIKPLFNKKFCGYIFDIIIISRLFLISITVECPVFWLLSQLIYSFGLCAVLLYVLLYIMKSLKINN